MKTILVPLDFSDVTAKVVDAAVSMARDLGAKVFLLHVVPQPVVLTAYGITRDQIPDFLGREQEQAREKLKACRDRMEKEGVAVSTLNIQGPAVESILLTAREHSVELLIMGSHGHGAFYEFIVGSTTRGVMQRFPGPVVVIPARTLSDDE